MGSHNRRHLRPKFVHVGTLGVTAGAIALAGQASAQSVHVDGQGFVAISLSGWQLTADGRALVTLTDGSTQLGSRPISSHRQPALRLGKFDHIRRRDTI